MGMESFYICLEIDKQVMIDNLTDLLKQSFIIDSYSIPAKGLVNGLLKKRLILDNQKTIDNCIVMNNECDNYLTKVFLIGCYANYEKYVTKMYEALNFLKKFFLNIEISYGSKKISSLSLTIDQFRKWVENCNSDKKMLFFKNMDN